MKKDVINNNKNVIEIQIKLNLIYISIKIFDFKKRENKKSRFSKKIIKRRKMFE